MKTKMSNILHVRREGHGQVLVLIHGVAGSGAIWGNVATELEQNFDVIRLDLLGYGYSPKPKTAYTIDDHITAIHATLQDIGCSEKVTLVGLSMGSLLSLEYAVRYPAEVKQIICIGLPYYRSRALARKSLKRSYWANLTIKRPRLARLLIFIIWGSLKHSRSLSSRFAPRGYTGATVQEVMMATYRSFSLTLKECLVNFRLDKTLPHIRTPVLFIHGSIDQWTSLADINALAARLSQAQVQIINGYLHNVVVLAPQTVAKTINNFLKSS